MSETWLEGFCFHLSIRFGKYIALNNSFINFFTDIFNKEQMMICYGISVLICACKNTKKTWTIKKKKIINLENYCFCKMSMYLSFKQIGSFYTVYILQRTPL